MRHVDDGTIHAWLDGEVADPTEVAWIEDHVRGCATCSARLSAERATLERARAILAGVAPVEDTLRPVFGALVNGAKHAAPASGTTARESGRPFRTWILPASWAASVALAVAIGWAARDLSSDGREHQDDARGAVQAQRPDVPAEIEPRSDAGPQPAASQRPTRPSVKTPGTPPQLGARARTIDAAPRQRVADEPAAVAAMPDRPAAEAASPADVARTGPDPAPASGVAATPATIFPLVSAETAVTFVPTSSPATFGGVVGGRGGRGGGAAGGGRGGGGRGGGRGTALGTDTQTFALGSPAAAGAGPGQAGGVTINGVTTPPAGVATTVTGSAWRTLPRTEAAVRSGMPLYGIEGLTPLVTMLSADAAVVRTVYQLDSGETVDVDQQKVADAPAGGLLGPAGIVAEQRLLNSPPGDNRPSSSITRGGVRVTLRGAMNLDALAARLRLD